MPPSAGMRRRQSSMYERHRCTVLRYTLHGQDTTHKSARKFQTGLLRSPPMASIRISFLSNSSTTYGSHQYRLRCMLSRLFRRAGGPGRGVVSSARWMASGSWAPGGSDSPRPVRSQRHLVFSTPRNSPENMRIVRVPERNWSDPLGGLGVVGRDGMGVTDREFSLPGSGY